MLWPMPLFLINFGFLHWCRYDYIGHMYIILAWGTHCGCILKIPGSLLGEELSFYDCFGLKSVEELGYPPMGLEPMHVLHIIGSIGPVSECPPA
jgi:hypothetical protein